MKRFQFQLEKLLRYHRQRQKQAELELSRLGLERDQAQAEVRRIKQAIESACRLSERVGQPIIPALREQSLQHAQQLSESLREAQENLKQADQRFRVAQNHYTAVTQQVEALLHLRSQRWDEHHEEAARLGQIELDDVVMKQWSRKLSLAGALADSTNAMG